MLVLRIRASWKCQGWATTPPGLPPLNRALTWEVPMFWIALISAWIPQPFHLVDFSIWMVPGVTSTKVAMDLKTTPFWMTLVQIPGTFMSETVCWMKPARFIWLFRWCLFLKSWYLLKDRTDHKEVFLFPAQIAFMDLNLATTRKVNLTSVLEDTLWSVHLYQAFSTEIFSQCSLHCAFQLRGQINCNFLLYSNVTKMCYLGNMRVSQSNISVDGDVHSYTFSVAPCKWKSKRFPILWTRGKWS